MEPTDKIQNEELIPEEDRAFLHEKGFSFEIIPEGGSLLIIIKHFAFPAAYVPSVADLMVQLPSGYPNACPDMFWTNPDVKMANGAWPRNSDYHQTFAGRNWQRWSRHQQSVWRPYVDGLRSFLASVRAEIAKGI